MSHLYQVTPKVQSDIETRFKHHAPVRDQGDRYGMNRADCLALAMLLCERCPPSRELSLALTHLEEVMFWGNAAIARNEQLVDKAP